MDEGILIAEHKEDKHVNFAEERLNICYACPLFIKEDKVCNPHLWMNPSTLETSKKAKAGFVRGCGCLISRKVKQKGSHCHLGLW